MKILTILFLTYYIIKVFNQNFMAKSIKEFMNKLGSNKEKGELLTQQDIQEFLKDKDNISLLFKSIGALIIVLILNVLEFFYIFFALQYGNKLITVSYIIFWFMILFFGLIKGKINKGKVTKVKKFSLLQLLIFIIDVAYFGYMYYILFLV